MRPGHRPAPERGQVLTIFALFMAVLLGAAALAIDVSSAFAARRFYWSVADAAALAGAQDLQQTGSRAVAAADRIRARQNALANVTSMLGASADPATCDTTVDVDLTDTCVLTGTDLHVSIKAGTTTGPPIVCEACDPERSVQVTVRNAKYNLSFAKILGQESWSVGVTSIAGLSFGTSYAIVTLRPPRKIGSTFDVKDVTINGGSTVTVRNGDVGSNANMTYSGTGSIMVLDPGFKMFYHPAIPPDHDPGWTPPIPPDPPGVASVEPIADPNYRYPLLTGSLGTAPTYDDARASQFATLPAVERADVDATCAAEAAKVDPTRYAFMATQAASSIYCYNPGIYESGHGARNAQIVAGSGDVALLKPGIFYLKSGADIGGRLIGGYEAGQPGVAVMFDETGPGNCSSCVFAGQSALTVALNVGTNFPPGYTGGAPATAAIDWDNQLVETSGPGGPTPPILMTLLVNKDPDCTVPTSGPFIEPAACDAPKNRTINVAGGGSLALQGVQYMPTDNVEITGGSSGDGRVGQIISWTLVYSGGTHIVQEGATSSEPGTLRLDGACTAPATPCSP